MLTTNQTYQQAQQPIFDKVGGISELSHMDQDERRRYFHSLNKYRTNLSVMVNEREEGRAEGLAEGLAEGRAEGRAEEKIENAKRFKELGVDIETIAKATGLTVEEVRAL